MIKLTLKEQERLTQYLSWVDITSESLSNEIGELLLNRDYIYDSNEIEKISKIFIVNSNFKINLISLSNFIESLDLNRLILYKRISENLVKKDIVLDFKNLDNIKIDNIKIEETLPKEVNDKLLRKNEEFISLENVENIGFDCEI